LHSVAQVGKYPIISNHLRYFATPFATSYTMLLTSNKATSILCPDLNDRTKEGICFTDKAAINSDSRFFLATGVWYGSKPPVIQFVPFPAPVATITDGFSFAHLKKLFL
jgi:hypothetical protein